jgi:hypothetical protein
MSDLVERANMKKTLMLVPIGLIIFGMGALAQTTVTTSRGISERILTPARVTTAANSAKSQSVQRHKKAFLWQLLRGQATLGRALLPWGGRFSSHPAIVSKLCSTDDTPFDQRAE